MNLVLFTKYQVFGRASNEELEYFGRRILMCLESENQLGKWQSFTCKKLRALVNLVKTRSGKRLRELWYYILNHPCT